MIPDWLVLHMFKKMRDLAIISDVMTDDERKEHERKVAEQRARDEAKRAREGGE